MEYANTFVTKILNKIDLQKELDCILKILIQNKVEKAQLLFGWAWGNDYKNWTPFEVKVMDIISEINQPQVDNIGQFGNDDLFITLIDAETEFLFCHESDVHMSFNNFNNIVSDVIERWNSQGIVNSN